MISTRDYILDAVRQNKPRGAHPYPQIPSFPESNKPLLEEFKENLVLGAGTWHDVNTSGDALYLIESLHPDARVICSAIPEIPGNKKWTEVTKPEDLNDVDIGIVRAQFGVSATGMVWLTEEDLNVISLGFLSQHLVILLKPGELVRDMPEAYQRIRLDRDNYGCFMLGPSATADIGAYMVHGAQGARSLSVFFM